MRIKVTEPILDYENEPVEKLTYRAVFSASLNNQEQGEVLATDQKAKMYELSHKIFASQEIKLTVDEAALLKERVAKFFNPLVYGRVCDLLDGNTRDLAASQPPADRSEDTDNQRSESEPGKSKPSSGHAA